ncbi:MAG: type I glyceraldehyde-3-phosphate dehydrogenase [Bacteroidetes bacterium]|nr:type I glyceraldehyde-3-phosphate dehydrogenase [Bacteroidota bacterium]
MTDQMKSGENTRIAINGMGRIGRTLLRLLHQESLLKHVIAVNDIMPKENLIYLLKYDSIRGAFNAEIISTQNGFSINGHEIAYTQQAEISKLNWKFFSIDLLIEATGLFTHSTEANQHISSGAKKVLLTTFGKDIPTTVCGVNHLEIKPETQIVSPGDCTINCVAPLIYLIDQHYGIESVHINVIQGYTTRQELLDAPYKGFRRGRAAAHSFIPFEVNIAPVLETIFSTLNSKIESMSTRVPVSCGAMADLSVVLKKHTTAEEINSVIANASKGEMKKWVSITYDPIVSSDVLGNPHASTTDGTLTKITNGNHLRLLAWFDNEWGYANRLLDWIHLLQGYF